MDQGLLGVMSVDACLLKFRHPDADLLSVSSETKAPRH